MRKLFFPLLVLALILGAGVAAAAPAAQAGSSFTNLASYFPVDTPIFAAVRTDDATLETLGAVISHVGRFIPGGLPPNFSMTMLLDQASAQMTPGGTFKSVFRSWLGDAVAVGVPAPIESFMSARSGPPVLIAVSITDSGAAEKFLHSLYKGVPANFFTKSSENGFTIWTHKDTYSSFAVAVGKDILLLGNAMDVLPTQVISKNLSTSDGFTKTLSQLPAPNYSALAYVDVPAVNRAMLAGMSVFGVNRSDSANPALNSLMEIMGSVYDALGPEALGLTILDGHALVMDAAVLKGDTSKLEALGLSMAVAAKPVDTAFAANIPADAPLVIQVTGFGPGMLNAFKNFRALGDYIQQKGILASLVARNSNNQVAAKFVNEYINLGNLLNFGEAFFTGMTGLNLENDVLSWMDGDFASYLRVLPSNNMAGVTLDLVSLTQASQPDAARNVVDKLESTLKLYRFPHAFDNGIISIPFFNDVLAVGLNMPDLKLPDLDLMIGSNDSVFVVGTRPGAQFSLKPDGAALADDPAFKNAQAYFLPGAQVVAYANLKPFYPLLEKFAGSQAQQITAMLNVLDSASMSGAQSDTASVARFVLNTAK